MPLAPGTRLGACEILEPLGAGGRGEVYRARDEYVDPAAFAWFHYPLENRDAALSARERGYEVGSPMMVHLVQGRPVSWREVADDPRYEALVRKMEFPPATVSASS